MSDYIIYNGELYHYGVKGMRWGHRKRQDAFSLKATGQRAYAKAYDINERYYRKKKGRFANQMAGINAAAKKEALRNAEKAQAEANAKRAARQEQKASKQLTPEQQAARRKKALKVGAAVAGTALAAYGGYKLAQYVQGQRQQDAMKKASNYLDKYMFTKIGDSTFKDGSRQFDFVNGIGETFVTRGDRGYVGGAVGRVNAKTVAEARQMYKNATNTKLDKGLAKVVNTGDAIGNATKRAATSAGNATKRAATSAGNAVKTSANKAKNSVLDAVNPIYEYKPGATRTNTRTLDNGLRITDSVTDYYKTKKRRR